MPFRPARLALCLLLLGAPVQAASEAEPGASAERKALPERSEVGARALERQLQNAEQQRLEADDERFLALWLPANTGKPRGAIILLPGDDQSADWPRSVGPLRRKLPDAEWHSLSLTLPDPASSLPIQPPAPSAADTPAAPAAPVVAVSTEELGSAEPAIAPEPADRATTRIKAHSTRVLQRIDAGVAFAQGQQAETIVLLGHGSGAYWAARYLAERKPEAVSNLLLVAAEVPPGLGPELDSLIPELGLATGDFYYQDRPSDRDAAIKRQQASTRLRHPAYVQVALKALPGNPQMEQEQLFRRIRGWLDRHLQTAAPAR